MFFDPEVLYAALFCYARDQGEVYPLSQKTLFRRVKDARLLVRTQDDRTTYPMVLEGSRRSVLHVATRTIFPKPG